MLKPEYIVRPHEIGSKEGKSWFLLVPAIVARELRLNRNTVFTLRPNKDTGALTFQKVYEGEKIARPAGQSLENLYQQGPIGSH
jgi:hypothetical protein